MKIRLNIYLDDKVKQDLEKLSRLNRRSLSQMIEILIIQASPEIESMNHLNSNKSNISEEGSPETFKTNSPTKKSSSSFNKFEKRLEALERLYLKKSKVKSQYL